ncbi:DUF6572 domain-containing protein [Caulobacter sp. DWR2-3-1b2]|uniref:DUF6572 domain-containing protein n=1 Tax=unclassified Caulobacter TaxID=2648921 RepID=UPI003CEF4A9B
MSVENANVIDGLGLSKGGSCVEMLISDHLPWRDPNHFSFIEAKVEAYANAYLSGQLVETLPSAEGKPALIRLVWKYQPDDEATRFLNDVRQQLIGVGIEFEPCALPDGD